MAREAEARKVRKLERLGSSKARGARARTVAGGGRRLARFAGYIHEHVLVSLETSSNKSLVSLETS
eukprot:4431461-Pyramimonas_sp.AAC.1